MGAGGFRELRVWQRAKALAVGIYGVTSQGCFVRDLNLRDQIRRAAVSVPSNLAEGDERSSNKDGVRFLYIAIGSLAELRTQKEIAWEIGTLDKPVYQDLEKQCAELARMLGSLIKARSEK